MTRKDIRWLWSASQHIRSRIILSSVVGVLHVCASLLFVWTCKQLVDIATRVSHGNLWHYTVLLIATVAAELFFSTWRIWLENRNDIRLKNKLRYRIFSRLMQGRWDGKERFHSGDVLNRLEEDVRVTVDALCSSFPAVWITGFQLLAAFIFLTRLDSRLAWVLLLIMPVFLVTSKFYMKRMRRLTKSIRTTDSHIQAHMQEKLQHKTLIQTFEQEPAMLGKLELLQKGLYAQVRNRISFTLFSRTTVSIGFAAGYLTAFLWGINGLYEGAISFGIMTAFLQLVGLIQRPIVDLSRLIPSFAHAAASVERLTELDDVPTEEQGECLPLEGKVGIKLSDVSFAYPDGEKEVVSNFSFDFKPGSRTAIVGETGVGKSTVIRLMLALLEPQKGAIHIYNEAQEAAASPLTRCNLVYVPQGNSLLSGTIRDNLLLGNPNATNSELRTALSAAAADFVHNLPDELDTLCGEGGAGLSEGQAQRICIARGLLRPGSILLLDEVSSSLDKETERLLAERLILQAKEKTLIFITHRDAIAAYFDAHILPLSRHY